MLARGPVRLEEEVEPGDPFWAELDLTPTEPLRVEVQAAPTTGRGMYVRGRLAGAFESQCRRCVEPVPVEVDEPFELLFSREPEDEEVYPLPERGQLVDLSEPVREALVLAIPNHVLCREDCKGLCFRCGADHNTGPCGCEPQGSRVETEDSPWAALRQIRFSDSDQR